jgi:hypothetical protein
MNEVQKGSKKRLLWIAVGLIILLALWVLVTFIAQQNITAVVV